MNSNVPMTQKPFEGLNLESPSNVENNITRIKKKNPKHIESEPVYLKKLAERLGSYRDVAKLIGTSGEHVSTGLRNNMVSKRTELAAKGIWFLEHEPPPVLTTQGKVFVSLLIHPQHLEQLRPWLKAAGVRLATFGS